MHLSIVSTLYRSEKHLPEFHRRMTQAASALTSDYEIIYINDGSPDDSQNVAEALCRQDPHTRLIELSRNFGHHKALMTGLQQARGKLVMMIDCDLEEEPELLLEFHDRLQTEDVDVVYGVQARRKGKLWERWTGALLYQILEWTSDYPVPKNICTARLMRRHFVGQLLRHRERELFLGGLLALTGFRQLPIPIHKRSRGETSYSTLKRIELAVNAITSFSSRPLTLIFLMGCAISTLSTLAGAGIVARKLLLGNILSGWTSLIVSVWLLGGLCLLSIGIVGIYLGKVFTETKARPYTIIRSVTGERHLQRRRPQPRRHRAA